MAHRARRGHKKHNKSGRRTRNPQVAISIGSALKVAAKRVTAIFTGDDEEEDSVWMPDEKSGGVPQEVVSRGAMRRSIMEGLRQHVSAATLLLCQECGSTFSRQIIGSRSSCPGCGSPRITETSAGTGNTVTCITCRHTWPMVSQNSVISCPSCGGNPFVRGRLIENDGEMLWVEPDSPLPPGFRRAPDVPTSNVVQGPEPVEIGGNRRIRVGKPWNT